MTFRPNSPCPPITDVTDYRHIMRIHLHWCKHKDVIISRQILLALVFHILYKRRMKGFYSVALCYIL